MNRIVPIRKQPANRWRLLDRLTADADAIVRRYHEIETLRPAIAQQPDARRAALSQHDEKVLARCHEALALLDPVENYEEDDPECGLRRSVVSVWLASLIGSFPNGAPGDPEVYVGMLLEHVCEVDGLGLLALDAACREIAATQKFLPTISEVLALVHEQQAKWDDRLWTISNIADASHRLVAKIEALQCEATAAARAVDMARRRLIATQTVAANLAQEIADGFHRLTEAEEKLQAAQATHEE